MRYTLDVEDIRRCKTGVFLNLGGQRDTHHHH